MPRFALTMSPAFTVVALAGIAAATCVFPLGAPRADAREPLLSPTTAQRLGLTESWRRALAVPAGAQSIVDQRIFVDRTSPVRYVEVVRGNQPPATDGNADTETNADTASEEPSEPETATGDENAPDDSDILWRTRVDQLDRFGNPIGEEEAKRLGRNEIRKLARQGIEATVSVRDVPTVLLYTLSNDGTLDCRDAETGQSRWMTRVGDRRLGYRSLGVDESFISVINGANLLVLDAADGSILNERQTFKAPGPGAVHVADYVLIPSIRSGIEGHILADPGADMFFEQVSGAALTVPTQGPGTSLCAWGTANGFVYVMELEGAPSVLFRLNTDGNVSARIAAAGDRFYCATDTGRVYAIRATRTGQVLWSRPLGEPFYDPPSLHEDRMLLRSTYGNLYSLATDTGEKTWERSVAGVDAILAVFDEQIYVRTISGYLAVLNFATGDRLYELREVQPQHILINRETNRLYLLSSTGTVQCLRPEDSRLPQFNESATVVPDDPEDEAATPEGREPERPASPQDDPFGPGESDPFSPPADGDDPFGGDGDPFGGDGDPFGGGF